MSTDEDLFLGRPTAKIMLLGTFHFHDPGLDAHRPKFTLDVFSERRQREIADVVERLAAFAPTKVAVEPWRPRFFRLWDHGDTLMPQQTLREILLRMNAEEAVLRGHGSYLVDAFKVGAPGEYPGVD